MSLPTATNPNLVMTHCRWATITVKPTATSANPDPRPPLLRGRPLMDKFGRQGNLPRVLAGAFRCRNQPNTDDLAWILRTADKGPHRLASGGTAQTHRIAATPQPRRDRRDGRNSKIETGAPNAFPRAFVNPLPPNRVEPLTDPSIAISPATERQYRGDTQAEPARRPRRDCVSRHKGCSAKTR